MAAKIGLLTEQPAMVYFPGQNINGRVLVEAQKKIKCTSLSISFKGFASVCWAEKDLAGSNTDQQEPQAFTAHDTYYEGQLQLWAGQSQEMPSGVSEFPFTFALPLNCPPSFEGKFGRVVHQMTVKFHSPLTFENITLVQPFSVNAVVDLNLNPNSREPQEDHKTHTRGCCCCRSGPLSVAVRLDKSGYAPGEPIVINAELNNKTKSKISGTEAKFIMETTYKAMGKTKLEQGTLTKISRGVIAAGAHEMWENEVLVIPPLPPSPLPGCNIIDVCYKLQFLVRISGTSSGPKMTFPINLGTIPTVDIFPSAPEASMSSIPTPYTHYGEASGGAANWIPFPGLEQYPQMPPPTYEQATALPAAAAGGKVAPYDVMEQDGGQPSTSGAAAAKFTPSYVTYNRRAAPRPPQPDASSQEKTSHPT